MKKDRNLVRIVGSGGKGGGREPYEQDDNMFARQHAAFIDAIAEGPIKGLVYGDASILIDETRLRDVNQRTGERNSAPNIQNFRIVEAKGDATQVPNADFFHSFASASVIEEIGSAELLLNEPQYHTISSGSFEKQNADYIKVTMATSGMVAITKKGDNAGDRRETKVWFDIDFRYTDNDGVTATANKFRTGFTGKVSGKYAHTFGFNIEDDKASNGITDWALKITRVGGDVSNDNIQYENAVYIDSIEAAIADKLEYPYTAYIAGAIDAEQFSSIPSRGYEVDGKLISIPSNHYPIDYNGRKVEVANTTNFAVGDTVKQDAVSVTALSAAFVNAEGDNDASEGYIATGTTSAAHGITIGNVFTATIDGVSAETDFWEGTFVCEATETNKFTYILKAPATSTTDPTTKTLSSTTASGTITASIFTGGMIDKIDTTNKYLYLRNVSPTANIILGQTITNAGSGSATVGTTEQVIIPANYRRDAANEKVSTVEQDWDGTFYSSWCNNPAWVYNDIMINKIYGLGNYISQSQVNKWELYQIGRYCDELVPAGVAAADLLSLYTTNDQNYTGDAVTTNEYEPRFSCNLVIGGKQEAYKVLNDVTSIFRGMIYWLNGEAYVVQDSEKDPVYQFTNGNVLDGKFEYEGSAHKTRTNQVIVNWNNPQDYYRPRSEIVELEETLQKDTEFIKADSITAFGCTSRGQARRLGKWKLLSDNLHTNTVSFSTSLNAAFLRPGDIVQIMDNQKSGKSWGGRVKTGSSISGDVTTLKIDRQWDKETGYDYNDYQVSITLVGYKALLAQDTATIQVGASNTNFVRGDEITTWRDADGIIASSRGWEDGNNDITIDSDEKAMNVFDADGNQVFIQWTPFTNTETKFIDASDNADPSTLTVNIDGLNSATFTEAPAADAIWIISRAALSTGKTKEEAKLYRVLQISESEANQFEINALEYNATKFDSVDKDEALSQERQVILPSSFDTTPAPTNLGYSTSLVKLNDNDGLVNRVSVSWDPPRNVSDNALYHFVREYEVFYSRDAVKWYHAGDIGTTSIDIDRLTSGTYHFQIFTKSVQNKRSKALTGKFTINFQRAVGPSEGTVGNGDYTINKIGTISGGYSINAGKVTFTPSNQQHDDGRNTHDITGQAQLDFTSLTGSDSNNNGANTGYIYMDHSANAFKAISHDEVSDAFHAPGVDPFTAATGTISGSVAMSNFVSQWHIVNGSTDAPATDFDGEITRYNKFKFTKSSTDYYHRAMDFDSDTPNSKMTIEPPLKLTVSAGQAFSKPTFPVDFQNDTIIGMVTKSAAGAYTLTKFGSSQGEGAYEVFGSNESHTFPGNTDDEISTSDYAVFTNAYTIQKDGQSYTYASSGTAANTFGLAVNAVTGISSGNVSIDGSGNITIADNSLDSVTNATITIRITDLQRQYTITDRVISLAKASSGSSGSSGTSAVAIKLTPDSHVVSYDVDGSESTTIAFTTAVQNSSVLSGTAYYQFLVDGTSKQNSTTATYTLADGDEPANGAHINVKVQLRDGGTGGDIKATDTVGIFGVKSGTDAYTGIVTNEAHTLPVTTAGAITYTGSGTDIRVFKGSTALTHKDSGTPGSGEFQVTVASDTNITVNASPSTVTKATTNDTRRYGVASSLSADTAEIEFSINCENKQTITKNQTFSKSKQGSTGDTGEGTTTVYILVTGYTAPSTPSAGTSNPPSGWQATIPTAASGKLIWYSIGTHPSGSTTWTWGAPQVYIGDFDYTLPGIFDNEWSLNLTGTGLGVLNLTTNDYLNSQVATPTYTSGSGHPSGTAPNGSTYIETGTTPDTLWISNGSAWIEQGLNTNTTYDAEDFNITDLDGYSAAAYANGSMSNAQAVAALGFTPYNATNPSGYNNYVLPSSIPTGVTYSGGTLSVVTGGGTTNTTIPDTNTTYSASDFNIVDLAGYSAAAYANSSLGWGAITVTAGSMVESWSTEDQSAYLPNTTTQTGTLSIVHPSSGQFDVTYTWTRTGLNIGDGSGGGFALTNTGSGNDAWTYGDASGETDNAFGSAAASKFIYVQHTASGKEIAIQAFVTDLSNLGGCLLPGSMIKHSNGETPIEEIEVGTKVIAYNETTGEEVEAEIFDKAPHKADFYYKVNDLKLTSGHPIWANDGWSCVDPVEYKRECIAYGHTLDLEPNKLGVGDVLYNGTLVEKIERVDEATEVWNIIIKDIHTYIADGILVHNGGGGGGGKCLTPAMLPEGLQIGDEVDSPTGKTTVVDIIHKQREGYYILENELEITNDHPILIDGEWILAEEYAGKKEYIDKPTEVVYVETENELLTVKGWTVGGKY